MRCQSLLLEMTICSVELLLLYRDCSSLKVYTSWNGGSRCAIDPLACSDNEGARFRTVNLSYDQTLICAGEKRRVSPAGECIAC